MSKRDRSAGLNCRQNRWRYTFVLTALALALIMIKAPIRALATSTVTGTSVSVTWNYLDETVTVNKGPGNSDRFYISLDKRKTWESIPIVGGAAGPAGQIDISAFLSSKAVVLSFRGNKDTNPVDITLMAEPNELKASYEVVNGEGRITYSGASGAVEYRKGSNGTWKTASNNMATSIYEVKGATFYYRTAATANIRAGKAITVKVPKRPAPPAVKLDGGKLALTGIKPNQTQYYSTIKGGWLPMTTDPKAKSVSLYSLLEIPVSNSYFPATMLEIRSSGDAKKPASGVRLLEILVQPTCPDTIKLEGTTLTISDPQKRSYEYTRATGNAPLNIATAKWTSISANKPVIVPKAAVNDVIYVRLKSTTDSKTREITPASTYKSFTVTSVTANKK